MFLKAYIQLRDRYFTVDATIASLMNVILSVMWVVSEMKEKNYYKPGYLADSFKAQTFPPPPPKNFHL